MTRGGTPGSRSQADRKGLVASALTPSRRRFAEDESAPPDKLVGALSSGLSILRHLARSKPPLGVNQIARELRLNPSTCFNLLKTLVHEGLVVFEPTAKTYALGLGFVEMARGSLERTRLISFARRDLERLVEDFRVTATVWQRVSADRVVLVQRVDTDSAIRVHMSLGQRLPLMIAALGRCMAAHSDLSKDELQRRFEQLRWQDAPSFDIYMEEVEAARANGYAIDMDRYVRGVTTVSAPVFEADGVPIMALSAIGFSGQFTPVMLNALAGRVRDSAQAITHALTCSSARRAEGHRTDAASSARGNAP